jgi:hypothetical protein
MVDGNPAKLFELTNRNLPKTVKERLAGEDDPAKAIRLWDATYRQRIAKWPVFLATEPEFMELDQPPQLRKSQMRAIFGRIPGTLNPPTITCEQLARVVRAAASHLG